MHERERKKKESWDLEIGRVTVNQCLHVCVYMYKDVNVDTWGVDKYLDGWTRTITDKVNDTADSRIFKNIIYNPLSFKTKTK